MPSQPQRPSCRFTAVHSTSAEFCLFTLIRVFSQRNLILSLPNQSTLPAETWATVCIYSVLINPALTSAPGAQSRETTSVPFPQGPLKYCPFHWSKTEDELKKKTPHTKHTPHLPAFLFHGRVWEGHAGSVLCLQCPVWSRAPARGTLARQEAGGGSRAL